MKMAQVEIKGTSALSMSKYIQAERKPKELHQDYEERCWRERIHRNKEGKVIIQPMMLVKSVQGGAAFNGTLIPGRGKERYKKHFLAGVRCNQVIVLDLHYEDVERETYLVPSDGKTGGTTRVVKHFPVIDEWGGIITFYILDDIITRDVFQETLNVAGQLVGIGRFRPERGGFYGCYNADILEWKEI